MAAHLGAGIGEFSQTHPKDCQRSVQTFATPQTSEHVDAHVLGPWFTLIGYAGAGDSQPPLLSGERRTLRLA